MPCSRTVTATGSGRSLARRARQSASASAHPVSPQHVCPLCKKHFTTSGHLKRHVEIHSGSRNFPCPIPGCETRCSRADNLQQHIKTHSASYVPRKAPKRDTKRNRVRAGGKAVPSPSTMQDSEDAFSFSFPALSVSVSASPPAFDDASTWSSYSQSSAEQSPPPTTPPSFAFSLPTSYFEQNQPEIHVPGHGHGLALLPLSLEPVELFRPKRLLVDTNFDAVVVPGASPSSAGSHSQSGVELIHPIPRASQPRSPLLDLQLDDSDATLVSPSTSESDVQSVDGHGEGNVVGVGASCSMDMDMDAPGCFYPYSGQAASSEWPAAMHMAASATATYDMEAYLAGLAYPASVSSAMIHAHTDPGDPGLTSYPAYAQQQHQFQ
uniref:C2H2-type domain-containing protein n=1 Tax=Mycena chlorophos TaxID=658473 RepID=A0ABQ0LD62_MYCCL|nr:predicted protein [Mycena chlorophos]